jgi:FkbM family methyltransferase
VATARFQSRRQKVVDLIRNKLRGTILHRLAHRLTGRESSDSRRLLQEQSAAYDRQTVEVMRRVLRRNSSCLDVGAHVGAVLSSMIEIAPDGMHHAFEPLPHLAEELRRRFPRVRIHQAAVSDSSGQSEFQYIENDPAYSGLRRRIYDHPDPRILVIQVPIITLDEVIPKDHPIAFIKIDIEGGEYHALKGAVNTLAQSRPVIVFEGGTKSTGQYGVTPVEVYSLIVVTLQYELSTMARWLDRRPPFGLQEFQYNWENGLECYFIATPREMAQSK